MLSEVGSTMEEVRMRSYEQQSLTNKSPTNHNYRNYILKKLASHPSNVVYLTLHLAQTAFKLLQLNHFLNVNSMPTISRFHAVHKPTSCRLHAD